MCERVVAVVRRDDDLVADVLLAHPRVAHEPARQDPVLELLVLGDEVGQARLAGLGLVDVQRELALRDALHPLVAADVELLLAADPRLPPRGVVRVLRREVLDVLERERVLLEDRLHHRGVDRVRGELHEPPLDVREVVLERDPEVEAPLPGGVLAVVRQADRLAMPPDRAARGWIVDVEVRTQEALRASEALRVPEQDERHLPRAVEPVRRRAEAQLDLLADAPLPLLHLG
jgi:hypothetical protein